MKILICAGTRPELIKLVPVILELKKRNIDYFFLYSGQQEDLYKDILEYFSIKIDKNFKIMKKNQSISYINTSILEKMEIFLNDKNFDLLIVQGDTSSAFSFALAGFYEKIPILHIEAGLRSFDNYSPFPEEINRSLITKLASYHMAPNKNNRDNLIKENIEKNKILVTGNTIVDIVNILKAKFTNISKKNKIIVSIHRREILIEEFKEIIFAIKELSNLLKNYQIIFITHYDEKRNEIIEKELSNKKNIDIFKSINYVDFIKEIMSSKLIISDSGGLQEESYTLNIPILVLRKKIERKEGLENNQMLRVDFVKEKIIKESLNILNNNINIKKSNLYGNGDSSVKIVDFILRKIYDKS